MVDRLRVTGQLTSFAGISATRSGVVIERKVSQGQVAQPGDPLFTVADLSNVWVVGALPSSGRLGSDGPASRGRGAGAGAAQVHRQGRVCQRHDSTETRTITVRTQVDNAGANSSPDAGHAAHFWRRAAAACRAARRRVRENDRDHVFVQVAAGQFRLTPVELGSVHAGCARYSRDRHRVPRWWWKVLFT